MLGVSLKTVCRRNCPPLFACTQTCHNSLFSLLLIAGAATISTTAPHPASRDAQCCCLLQSVLPLSPRATPCCFHSALPLLSSPVCPEAAPCRHCTDCCNCQYRHPGHPTPPSSAAVLCCHHFASLALHVDDSCCPCSDPLTAQGRHVLPLLN